ncbi:hypothetical protein D910_04152 [Dendroctonus ponderosae]|uniref:Afadin n=1 Tax=Dendroctonus ponderosae TaxID=77166 RepID=U4U812_DENPD|nr:hypothetical protein D910_04152 [Dendroctonus ponderosae]
MYKRICINVGSANGIALQLYGPHIQPRHCVITNAEGVTSLTPCHADAHTYVNGQRIHQTTILTNGSLVKFGNSNTYRFVDPAQEDRIRHPLGSIDNQTRIYESRSPRALSPTQGTGSRENIETTFDIDGNVETVSTHSGAREDNRSLGSDSRSENRLSGMERYARGQDPILPAVLEFPEDPQEQFLARVITHLDVTTPTFRLAPAYTLYLCARYRASTHYRPELTPTERAHKLTLVLQHAAMLIRHTVQDRSTESTSQAFWLANASELLHFLKSDRHVNPFSLQAQDTLADAVQLAFKNLVACLTDELNSGMAYLMSVTGDDHPREVINILSGAMNLLRKCRVNAALTIQELFYAALNILSLQTKNYKHYNVTLYYCMLQLTNNLESCYIKCVLFQLFSQLFHWISAKALTNVISNSNLCTRNFGNKLANRLRNLQAWAESQGLELAAECHLAKIVQCAHLLQANKYTPEDLANLSAACFKLNSMQLGALLMQYKAEPGEKIASPSLVEQAAKAAESVADELARAEGREVTLYEDPAPPLQLLLPDDGFSCDVVQGVPPGLADFLHPLKAAGLCRLAAQPTSSGHWTVYMKAPRPPSALSTTQPEVQVIRLHKAGGGMGLSIVAAKGAGQERLGIYIKSVVPGGAADRDGRLAAGDQLVSVDGQSLLGITQEKAAEFLVRTGSVVTLEVAKGGAVYHGLATLLQQPSPTPHRVLWDQTSRYTQTPVIRSSLRLFLNRKTTSDDSLFKTEKRKFVIPRIEIQSDEPVFSLQVTDFSDPAPKNVTLTYDESGQSMKLQKVEEYIKPKTKAQEFAQNKSYSIDVNNSNVDISSISEIDKFLSIGTKKLSRQKATSTSLIDLSSSTSSINSCIYESNLDLSQLDPDTPLKHWKSPFEMRHAKNLERDNKATSDPSLNKKKFIVSSRSKSVSEENLNDKLTEYERLEILKLLHDWSLNGSDSKSEFNMNLNKSKSTDNIDSITRDDENVASFGKFGEKFLSEPDLSPKSRQCGRQIREKPIILGKYSSESRLSTTSLEDDFLHKCKYRNCIFNIDFIPKFGTITSSTQDLAASRANSPQKLKGILKNSREKLDDAHKSSSYNGTKTSSDSLKENADNDCWRNINNLRMNEQLKSTFTSRRNSETIQPNNAVNSDLTRCDSLERLTQMRKPKKFPDSYIVTRRGSFRSQRLKNSESGRPKSPKIIVLRKKYMPKTWKSCSDIKPRKQVKKCCKYAKKSCPVLRNSSDSPKTNRKTKSCACISEENILESAPGECLNVTCLLELTLSALFPHPNPYSRTSSNNSINTNNPPTGLSNGPIGPTAVRSRSTHNLNQQDGGFYQNLSVYRNKEPSPQQLGDRTSALRSSQNSLQSSITSPPNSQRPSSAYYPTNQAQPNFNRPNLHQSIPNLKSPPSMQRLQQEDNGRLSGSYPNVGGPGQQQYYGHQLPQSQQQQPYIRQPAQPAYPGAVDDPLNRQQYNSSYANSSQPYPSPTHSNSTNYSAMNNGTNNYSQANSAQQHAMYNSSLNSAGPSNGQKFEERVDPRIDQRGYATPNTGLLREDLLRQSHNTRHDEIMRYPSTNNVRISEAQIQNSRGSEDLNRSEDALKQPALRGEMLRYASSGNIRAHDINQPLRPGQDQQHRLSGEERLMRGQAKLTEMGEELKRRQQHQQQPSQPRVLTQMPPNAYYQQQQQQQHYYNNQMAQSMQNLSINPTYQNQQPLPAGYNQNYAVNQGFYQTYGPNSPTYRPQNNSQKPAKRPESPPVPPPTNTHPLYSPTSPEAPTTYTASNQDPPKMALYPMSPTTNSKPPRDPWAREEQERQQEARREVSRQWQEQQIRELMTLPYRTQQQEEQLRVLQLEREFQRRAQEAAGEDDDETEKESPTPHMPQPVSSQTVISTVPSTTVSSRQEQTQPPPASILKPGGNNSQVSPSAQSNVISRESHATNQRPPSPAEPILAPPPPERGSSFAVMSMRGKDSKRVSFDPVSTQNNIQQQSPIPTSLPVKENAREDPNSFILQAESMLASPTTPTDPSLNVATATPGVIGAQEVYRDPRARRLAEQQKKSQNETTPVPEKLSFKEKMKMFAMETGEQETPKDKSKISRAQREIDNLGSPPPNSGMVH